MKILFLSLCTFVLSAVALDTNNVTFSLRALSTSCDSTVLNNYCYGSLNLNAEGIWVSWDNTKSSPPENAVEGGSDASGTYYVSRSLSGDLGVIPGKYSPNRKYAWFSYGGGELGSNNFDVLRHTNCWWGEITDDATKWIPAGIDTSGNVIYICQAQVPASINANQYTVPGKFHNGRCYIPFNGQEIGYSSGFKVLRQSLR